MSSNLKIFFFSFLLSLLFSQISLLTQEKITFEKLLNRLKESNKKRKIAVAGADNLEILKCVVEVKNMGIADAILVGNEGKIREKAAGAGIDVGEFRIINEPDPIKTARTAVKLVSSHEADMFMKGSVDTANILRAILDKEIGLRTGRPLSVTAVFEVEGVHKMLFLTDPAVMPYPTLKDKIKLIENSVEVANACGIQEPKVAPIAAIEVVNPKMPCTVDGGELTKMNEEGKIKNCIIDGPLSMDLAIDPSSAELKGATNRKIVGDADILLFPDIHSANIAYKLLTHVSKSKSGNLLTGTTAPVILTSRADSSEVKINSVILAALFADGQKNN